MRPRYSFSSRHTRKTQNMRKQRGKYPIIAKKIIEDSDILLQVLDARFIHETRNISFEEEIKKKKKRVIYVFNKADLIDKTHLKIPQETFPYVLVSSTLRKGIKELRDRIKREAKMVNKKKKENEAESQKIVVGVIGYPNTGKSSLINSLIGKASAGVGSDAGFTKSMQKIKLSQDIVLIDSPGIIPENEYSPQDREKISLNARLGARSYSQIREPELVVVTLIRDYPNVLERFYKIDAKGDPEILLEELGKKKGFLKRGGEVNEDTTARLIIKDWQTGNIKL